MLRSCVFNLLSLSFCFLFCSVLATAQAQLTIDSCQVKARANYPLIKQFDLIEKSKNMTIANANKAYLPQLSITAIGGIMDGMPNMSAPGSTEKASDKQFIGMAQLNQVIWDGGMIRAQKKIAEAGAEVEQQQAEVSLYAIRDQVNQLFFGILLVDEQLKQLDILNENLTKNLSRAETAYTNGTAYQSDVDALKVEILNLEQNRTQQSYLRGAYAEMLSHMIGEKIADNTTFEKPIRTSVPLSDSITRPEMRLFDQQRKMYDAQNSALTAELMPKLGIMGFGVFMQPGINFGIDKLDHVLVAGLSLSWNIGSLYTVSNNRKKIKNSLLQVDVQQETFLFNTNIKLKQSNSEIAKYKQLLEKDDEIVTLRKNIKQATETKYANGVCTMTELIQKINDENLARQNKALHEVQYLLNIYNYNTTIGK